MPNILRGRSPSTKRDNHSSNERTSSGDWLDVRMRSSPASSACALVCPDAERTPTQRMSSNVSTKLRS
eukprot:2699894-Rhodomonas_salina.1